ncbi:MAG TPA: hypothetical protein VD886_18815 [Herpetosiphonaceae bacterium]|nr:hypothetical protein [Herpetosiphonaceae bacterium]
MNRDLLLAAISFGGTLLLVMIGLLNFTVFLRQLRAARDQIDMSLRQLDLAQKQPEIQLIQRAIAETNEHVRLLVERPYLRPYFYDGRPWSPDDRASQDEVKAMAELILNNFASALMHSAAFPQYPVGSIDQMMRFHLRNSPALREFLFEYFDRFPITGMSLLCLKGDGGDAIEADLERLIAAAEQDPAEQERRRQLLGLFRRAGPGAALEFTRYNLDKARGQTPKGISG